MPSLATLWLRRQEGASAIVVACVLMSVAGAWLPRALVVYRFRQDGRGVVLHPIGVVLLLSVQWCALIRRTLGLTVSWKERAYAGE